MGNLGNIMRSCAGFGIEDLAVIGNGADAYHPKTVRASMGAFFHLNIQYFGSFEDYTALYGKDREICTFMLNGETGLYGTNIKKDGIYSLIFGNESSGLDKGTYKNAGRSVGIRHNDKIDSLSLPIAVGIALFWFFGR